MADQVSARLIMLPGLGADARLCDPQRPVFSGLEVPPWIQPRPHESLPSYARRMAETIAVAEPFYLGGISFGGMVALEMAPLLRPQAVFLIASCRSGDSIAPHLKYLARFAKILPERVFATGAGVTPLFAHKFGRLDADQKKLLQGMLTDAVPAFVRWGIAAITEWRGGTELTMPVHHIHGSDDQLVPAESVRPDVLVPGGSHMLNVTHAQQVNEFLAARMT